MGDLKSKLVRPYRLLRRNTPGKTASTNAHDRRSPSSPTIKTTTTTLTTAPSSPTDTRHPPGDKPSSPTQQGHPSPQRSDTGSTGVAESAFDSLDSSLVRDFGTDSKHVSVASKDIRTIDSSLVSLPEDDDSVDPTTIPTTTTNEPVTECPELKLQEPSPDTQVPGTAVKTGGGGPIRSIDLVKEKDKDKDIKGGKEKDKQQQAPAATVDEHEADDEATSLPKQSPKPSPRLRPTTAFRKQSLVPHDYIRKLQHGVEGRR